MVELYIPDILEMRRARLERVHFFPRQLLTADDMVTEQNYFRQKLRRHNRFLHGWGVVCGLEVTPAPEEGQPWRVKINTGYALGPFGDEIYVAEPIFLDLAWCGPDTATDPCEPGMLRHPQQPSIGPNFVYVVIKYAECYARPMRVMPAGCACEEEACEYTRIRDSFQIECLTELPASHLGQPGPTLCELINRGLVLPCPPCPTEPWVVLAKITLPSANSDITNERIDNMSPRRQLFSTAVLQEQLIECCCAPPALSPTRVISIEPPNNTRFTLRDPSTGDPSDEVPSNIVIGFDKSLQAATVNTNTVQVWVSRGTPPLPRENVPGTVSYIDAQRSAQFTPDQPFEQDVTAQPPFIYEITVRGDGLNRILDVDGLALDGNGDGLPGGNFSSQFTIDYLLG